MQSYDFNEMAPGQRNITAPKGESEDAIWSLELPTASMGRGLPWQPPQAVTTLIPQFERFGDLSRNDTQNLNPGVAWGWVFEDPYLNPEVSPIKYDLFGMKSGENSVNT